MQEIKKKINEDDDKQKNLKDMVLKIEKDFGKGAIIKLGDSAKQEIPYIPTGIITLDVALGIGGIPRGRIIEIFGPESSGKTTLALSIIATAQKLGGISAFVDAEHALDPKYAKLLGVDIDNLYVSQPDFGEQALEIVENMVRSNSIDVIVVDSVAALVPRAEIEGDMGDTQMGAQARLMSQALRKLTAIISKTNTCLIFINQIRMKIGVMFGNPETTTGGNALKFYSSLRLDVRKVESLKKADEIYGNLVRVKVVKNKVAPPFKHADFEVIFNEGIQKEGCILDLAVQKGIIQKSGTWYSYGDERIGQGKDNAVQYLKQNKNILDDVDKKVRGNSGLEKDTNKKQEVKVEDQEDEKKIKKTVKKTS